jgi:hypothetical protein
MWTDAQCATLIVASGQVWSAWVAEEKSLSRNTKFSTLG